MTTYLRMTQTDPEAYSLTQLRQDNPSVSFPDQISAELLANLGCINTRSKKDRASTQVCNGSFTAGLRKLRARGFGSGRSLI